MKKPAKDVTRKKAIRVSTVILIILYLIVFSVILIVHGLDDDLPNSIPPIITLTGIIVPSIIIMNRSGNKK